jgi:acyl-CoA synthetase (AMP-forming)/AMP-acid ligase II
MVNLPDLDLGLRHDASTVLVTWLPIFHDLGLIYGALMPIYRGFNCYMLPPAAFLRRPSPPTSTTTNSMDPPNAEAGLSVSLLGSSLLV